MSKAILHHLRQVLGQICPTPLIKLTRRLKSDERGQSFIEFIFLLAILMGMSLIMVAGFNGTVGKQWAALVQAVARPNTTDDFDL